MREAIPETELCDNVTLFISSLETNKPGDLARESPTRAFGRTGSSGVLHSGNSGNQLHNGQEPIVDLGLLDAQHTRAVLQEEDTSAFLAKMEQLHIDKLYVEELQTMRRRVEKVEKQVEDAKTGYFQKELSRLDTKIAYLERVMALAAGSEYLRGQPGTYEFALRFLLRPRDVCDPRRWEKIQQNKIVLNAIAAVGADRELCLTFENIIVPAALAEDQHTRVSTSGHAEGDATWPYTPIEFEGGNVEQKAVVDSDNQRA
ncbi:unnamed protein product [Amoebophrya sp. A25]|nr:unnamed protein product [Amoebophrya sp. A25]|eukprot:GSA25T00021435001.1